MELCSGTGSDMPRPPLNSASKTLLEYGDDIEGYAAIHPVAIAQSCVLSSILESSGNTELPSSVSFPEFRLWQKAVVLREDKNGKNKMNLDLRTVCGVMKAADVMGDAKFDEWVALAWRLLFETLCKRAYTTAEIAAIRSFLHLPDHIQHLVFMTAASKSEEKPKHLGRWRPSGLAVLLCTLPCSVHRPILTAFSGPGKTLIAPGTMHTDHGAASLAFFYALTTLPSEPPSVLTLVDSGGSHSANLPQTVAPAAACALRRHSGLTRLSFSQVCSSVWRMQQLAPAIAALPHLKDLQLGAEFFRVPIPALSALADSFRPSQMLQHLTLYVKSEDTDRDATGTKRRRIEISSSAPDDPAPDAPASPSNTVLRLLSSLSRLTFLAVNAFKFRSCRDEDMTHVHTPIHLPYLEALHLPRHHNFLPVNIISNLAAHTPEPPVKHLAIEFLGMRTPPPETQQALCTGLQKLVHLTSLSLSPFLPGVSGRGPLSAHVPSMFAPLQHLRQLKMKACFAVLLAGIPSVTSGLTELSLDANAECARSDHKMAIRGGGWEQLCAAISRMTLRSLHLDLPLNLQRRSLPGLSQLSVLSHLTALSLQNWGTCLGRPTDRDALSRMSDLQSLRITGIRTEHAFQPAVRRAMTSLSQLTELTLTVRCTDSDDTAAIAVAAAHAYAGVPAGAWRGVTSLELPVTSAEAARGAVVSAARLPALRWLCLHTVDVEGPLSDEVEAELEALADEAGVDLGLEYCGVYSSDDESSDSSGDEAE